MPIEGDNAEIIYAKDGITINNQKKEILANKESEKKQTNYNQLIIPLGRRSIFTFSEGTRMWVNAGSRVVYPSTFDKEKREIYVDGEVYLDVTHNETCPFIVKIKDYNIKVLGTSFNITAYEKDNHASVILESGSVQINSNNSDNKKETFLSPNENVHCRSGTPLVRKVNTYDYTSWRDGIYQYNNENLGAILIRLSRYYGTKIEYNESVSVLKCSGKLELKEELSQVLNGIAKTAPIKCHFENNKYIVTNK